MTQIKRQLFFDKLSVIGIMKKIQEKEICDNLKLKYLKSNWEIGQPENINHLNCWPWDAVAIFISFFLYRHAQFILFIFICTLFHSPCASHGSYYGVLMAFGGLQEVRKCNPIYSVFSILMKISNWGFFWFCHLISF